jgi:hypothetical protein
MKRKKLEERNMSNWKARIVVGGVGWLTGGEIEAMYAVLPTGGAIWHERKDCSLHLTWRFASDSGSTALREVDHTWHQALEKTGVAVPELIVFHVTRVPSLGAPAEKG